MIDVCSALLFLWFIFLDFSAVSCFLISRLIAFDIFLLGFLTYLAIVKFCIAGFLFFPIECSILG